MKRNIAFSLILLISATLLISASAFAASNSLKYSDQLQEKLLCSNYLEYCEYFYYGKFQIDAKIYLDGVDINQFNDDTCFYVGVGNFSFDACLGDDPSYIPPGQKGAKTSARFVLRDYDWISDRDVDYLWVTLKWSKKNVTIKVKALTMTPDIAYPILALDYLWWGENYSIQETLMAEVEFAGILKTFDVNSTGKVKLRTKKKYGEEYEYSDVKIKGTGY